MRLGPKLVDKGEKVELECFKQMGVCEYVSASEAMQDCDGKTLKVKWTSATQGGKSSRSCAVVLSLSRLVAQELGFR